MRNKLVSGLECLFGLALAFNSGCSTNKTLEVNEPILSFQSQRIATTQKSLVTSTQPSFPVYPDSSITSHFEIEGYSLGKVEAHFYGHLAASRSSVSPSSDNRRLDRLELEYISSVDNKVFSYFMKNFSSPLVAKASHDQFEYYARNKWGWESYNSYLISDVPIVEAVSNDSFSKLPKRREIQWPNGGTVNTLTTQASSTIPPDLIKRLIEKTRVFSPIGFMGIQRE